MADYITVEFDGVTLSGYSTDYVIQTIQNQKNFYEVGTLSKWFPFIMDAKYIVDVGANLGNHTIYWATKMNVERIVSYEPFAANFEVLEKNIKQNSLTNVVAINKAVGQHVGNVKLKSFDESNYGATSFEEGVQEGNTVSLTSIDNEVIELKLPKVDLIKIDTEGFELDVLKGMTYVLDKYHPIIWVECSEESIKDVIHILSKYDYQLFDIEDANVLFIQTKEQSVIELDDILYQRFRYLTKTNIYYSNYIKTKGWLEEKNKAIQDVNASKDYLKEQLSKFSEQYKKAESNYLKVKEWLDEKNKQQELLNEKNKQLEILDEKNNKRIKELEIAYSKCAACKSQLEHEIDLYREEINSKQEQIKNNKDLLLEAAAIVYENESTIIDAKRDIEDLKEKLKKVTAKYNEDERKLGIIHDHWYWRAGLNVYLWAKKIKHKLKG